MPQQTMELVPKALQRVLDRFGLSYEDAAARVRVVRPRSRITRAMVWRAATDRRSGVSPQTATDLVWALDVQPSTLFVMPWPPLAERDGSNRRES